LAHQRRWQIAYYDSTGRRIRETYKTQAKAEKMLARRLAQLEAGMLETERRVRVDELASTDLLSQYIEQRLSEGVQGSTVNRELAVLHAMFELAARSAPPKVTHVPVFPPKLKESAPRSGFVRDADYEKIVAACPSSVLRALIVVAYSIHVGERQTRSGFSEFVA
jgi:integrase